MANLDFKAMLEAEMPGAILKETFFGTDAESKATEKCFWIRATEFRRVSEWCLQSPTLILDWLENLSVAQVEGDFHLTYFLRSTTSNQRLILRQVIVAGKSGSASVASVADLWPMSERMEREAAQMFGLVFTGFSSSLTWSLLPAGWVGFPLRKDYEFPEVLFPEKGSG